MGKWGVLENPEWIKRLKPEKCSNCSVFLLNCPVPNCSGEALNIGSYFAVKQFNLLQYQTCFNSIWNTQSAFTNDHCLIKLLVWLIFLLATLKSKKTNVRVQQSTVSNTEIICVGCENTHPSYVPFDLLRQNRENQYSSSTVQPAATYSSLFSSTR